MSTSGSFSLLHELGFKNLNLQRVYQSFESERANWGFSRGMEAEKKQGT